MHNCELSLPGQLEIVTFLCESYYDYLVKVEGFPFSRRLVQNIMWAFYINTNPKNIIFSLNIQLKGIEKDVPLVLAVTKTPNFYEKH